MDVRVSHVEELGNETLIYGDLNMEGDGYVENSTRVIIKAFIDREFEKGEIIKAAFNFAAAQFFDINTKDSILPRIPQVNVADCTIKNNKLSFLEQSIVLPSAIPCEDLKGELYIPTSAVSLGGTFDAKISDVEKIGNTNLLYLNVGGRIIFATTTEEVLVGKMTKIDIDIKELIVYNQKHEMVIDSLRMVNTLPMEFIKVKEKATIDGKEKTGIAFKYRIGNEIYSTPPKLLLQNFSLHCLQKHLILPIELILIHINYIFLIRD